MEYYGSELNQWGVFGYYQDRVCANLEILDGLKSFENAAEACWLYGALPSEIQNRGSQYKVESVMIRGCKREIFSPLATSKNAVKLMSAAECLPLAMGPEPTLYSSPIVVLDFRALYPLIMIAYNYCHLTCLGRTTANFTSKKPGASFWNFDGQMSELKGSSIRDSFFIQCHQTAFSLPHPI
jgi:DNA polymerase zeta